MAAVAAVRHNHRQVLAIAVVLAVVAALAAVLAQPPVAAASSDRADSEHEFVGKMNAARRAQGLGPLAVHSQMRNIARDWTPKMIAHGSLRHRPGDQLTSLAPDDWLGLGENVGRSVKTGATASELVDRLHRAFMDSPGHRANILGNYNYVGVGVRLSSDGAMWVTVNFLRAPSSQQEVVPPPPSVKKQIAEAIRVSQAVFADAGATGRTAAFAVLGRGDVFADALGGSALAADQGPILFTSGPSQADPRPSLEASTRVEIDRVLGGSGTVYLLGGTAAVSDRVATELAGAGYTVRRLGGASRVETSVRIAEEAIHVHGRKDEVLIARADEWPDAVAGGAYAAASRTPLVLTNRASLHDEVAGFLRRENPTQRWALGGRVALFDETVARAQATRVYGPERTATAVAIAERLWKRTSGTHGDKFATAPSHGDEAWAYALAQAPWAAAYGGPQLLVGNSVPASVSDYLARLDYNGDRSAELFTASSLSATVIEDLRRMTGR